MNGFKADLRVFVRKDHKQLVREALANPVKTIEVECYGFKAVQSVAQPFGLGPGDGGGIEEVFHRDVRPGKAALHVRITVEYFAGCFFGVVGQRHIDDGAGAVCAVERLEQRVIVFVDTEYFVVGQESGVRSQESMGTVLFDSFFFFSVAYGTGNVFI